MIRPDMSAFRQELEAQLRAVTAKPVLVPVRTVVQQAQDISGVARESAQKAGAEIEKQSAATTKLAVAQNAAEEATRKLAFSQEAVVGAASAASAAQVQLTRSTAAVAAAERAVALATQVSNQELIESTNITLTNARARQTQAASTLAAARAERAHASSTALAARGAGATGLSLLGARGATLAASNAFLVGAASAVFLKGALDEATDATETFRRATLLFGDELASELAEQAEGIGEAFAIDDDDVVRFEVQVGKILRAAGLTREATAGLSAEVVQLAADMAAFNRVPVEDTLRAIQLGLAGNTRSLKQFGVLVDQAAVKQLAMERTGKRVASTLTQQELVLARYTLILQDAQLQQGAFAEQAGSLAAQSQRLKVNFHELQETIGKALVPAVGGLVTGLNESFTAFNRASDAASTFAGKIPVIGDSLEETSDNTSQIVSDLGRLYGRFILLGPAIGPVSFALDKFTGSTDAATQKLSVFDKIAGLVAKTLGGVSAALDKVAAGVPSAAQQASLSLVLAQASGDQDAELALLREQEQRQADFLAGLLEEPALTEKALELQKKAAENLRRTRDQIEAIERERESAAAAARRAAEAARREAERAAQAAQQEFLARQQLARQQAANRVAEAAQTPALRDDLDRQRDFLAIIRAQVAAIKKRIKDREAQRAAIAALRSIELQVLDAIARLNEEIQARQDQIRDAATGILERRLRLAEARGQRDEILAALNAAIADARKRVKAAKDLATRLDEQIALQELINRRNEVLNEKTKETNALGRELFEFLQAQQGFASNLLSNLIPQSATGGLVGGASLVPPVGAGGAPPSTGVVPVDFGISAAAGLQEARQAGGPTAGQAQTTNGILGMIYRELVKLNAAEETPEATKQRKRQKAVMDGVGGG